MKYREIVFATCALALLALALLVCYALRSVFVPVLLALILAYLFDPLVTPLERRGLNRSLAIAVVFAAFAGVLVIGGTLFVGSIADELASVQLNLPGYAERLYGIVPDQVKLFLGVETPDKLYQQASRLVGEMRGASTSLLGETFSLLKRAVTTSLGFVLALLGYLITPVYLYYFLKDLPAARRAVPDLLPARYRDGFLRRVGEIDLLLSAFVRGQLSVCAILAVLYSAGLYVIGIDLALAIGTVAGAAFIIPYFGTVLGIVLSMLMALLKFHDVLHPLLCLGWFGVVQALEGTVITPKIVGDTVGLHPVVTILALFIGGQLFGILGMLLAVPVTAVLKVFSRALFERYRQSACYLEVS